MKKAKDDFNWDEWRMALADLNQQKCDAIPPGWITAEQFAASPENQTGYSYARKLLVDLFRKGKAERRKWRVPVGDSGIRPIWHYRLLKK